MTIKEAIGNLECVREHIENPTDEITVGCAITAITAGIEALEKQVPKKPEEQETTEKTHYKCKCGYIMLTIWADGYHLGNKPKYCERCGQAIDWEDVD